MKTCLVLLSLLVPIWSIPALAHMKIGRYTGTNSEGQPCGFEVKSITFVDGFRHPLNERVEILADNVALTLAHPALVDAAQGKVGFEHDLLVGTKAIRVGSVAGIVKMDHSNGNEGPTDFTYVLEAPGDPASSMRSVCGTLVEP